MYLSGIFIRTRQIIKALCSLGHSVNIIELGYRGTRSRTDVNRLQSKNATYLTVNCVAQAPSKSIGLSLKRQLAFQAESLKTVSHVRLLRKSSAVIITSCLQPLPALVSKLLRVQVVLDINDVNSRVALQIHSWTTRALRYLLWRSLEGFVCKLADLIVVNKQDEKEFLVKYMRIQPSKILIVKPCLMENKPTELQNPRPGRFGFDNDRVVLFLANMTTFMNQRSAQYIIGNLAPNFAKLPEFKDLQFILAGVGSERLSARTSNVLTTGTLDEPSLQALIDRADICIDPALIAGGVKTKIQHYLKNEKIVVTTPFGAEGINLYGRKDIAFLNSSIEDFEKTLKYALRNIDHLKKLAVNNRDVYERQFSWGAFVEQVQTLTRRISETNRPLPGG